MNTKKKYIIIKILISILIVSYILSNITILILLLNGDHIKDPFLFIILDLMLLMSISHNYINHLLILSIFKFNEEKPKFNSKSKKEFNIMKSIFKKSINYIGKYINKDFDFLKKINVIPTLGISLYINTILSFSLLYIKGLSIDNINIVMIFYFIFLIGFIISFLLQSNIKRYFIRKILIFR